MSSMPLQTSDVNAFQPLKPTAPGPRPRTVREPKARKGKANPRDAWPKWTDFVQVSIVEDDDEYRPTAEIGFAPARLDDVEWTGMALALAGEPMAEMVATEDTSLLLRFAVGQYRGLVARHDAERAARAYDQYIDGLHADRLMAAFCDPTDAIHPNESRGVC